MNEQEKKVIEQAIEAILECLSYMEAPTSTQPYVQTSIAVKALRTLLKQESVDQVRFLCYEINLREAVLAVCCDPEGRVVIRGSDGDRAVLQEALAAEQSEPTYGQLKIRLEKAQATIEMQRRELFNLRDAPPKQESVEPVAWMCSDPKLLQMGYSMFSGNEAGVWNIPVYTAPLTPSVSMSEVKEMVERLRSVSYKGSWLCQYIDDAADMIERLAGVGK